MSWCTLMGWASELATDAEDGDRAARDLVCATLSPDNPGHVPPRRLVASLVAAGSLRDPELLFWLIAQGYDAPEPDPAAVRVLALRLLGRLHAAGAVELQDVVEACEDLGIFDSSIPSGPIPSGQPRASGPLQDVPVH